MKQNELSKIQEALASTNPTVTLPSLCRDILRERLDEKDICDRKLRHLLEDIIEQLDFSCKVKLTETKISDQPKRTSNGNTIFWGVIGFIGLCAIAAEGTGIRISGGIAVLAGGIGLGTSLSPKIQATKVSTRLETITTVEDVVTYLNLIYARLTALFNYRQLEGVDLDVLEWLQRQYADTKSTELRKSIDHLLHDLGYHFEEFSPDRINDFKTSIANVETVVTTIPALINKSKCHTVLKGIVVFPLEK